MLLTHATGLDYWSDVDLHVHDTWDSFSRNTMPSLGNTYLVSKRERLGASCISDTVFFEGVRGRSGKATGVGLVFGNEVEGLDKLEPSARQTIPAVYLPMRDGVIRSYNLSNAVAMALYEVHRQQGWPD
ncbi:unnamed protein product [Discosporangium mesarthrocarpum]